MARSDISVTSHVGRDLLQSAALFKYEHSVVWEYVSNGLQYIDRGVNPNVSVEVASKARRISIQDNGRGMDREDLQRYFQMHAENLDIKRGRPGRGRFGTGKSAAFGIADTLRVTTVKDGKRSKVELRRADIEIEENGGSIPLRDLETAHKVRRPNGTLIEIEDIHLDRIDARAVIRHIERHIVHWPNASVLVNRQECRYEEPPISETHLFHTMGTPFEEHLGCLELNVNVAKGPLDKERQGVAVLSGSVWHETTLAGSEKRPFANYIFGTIDVPAIGSDKSPISPFDMSRSMRLNPRNEIVRHTYAFVGASVETVLRQLEKRDRDRRRDEETQKLKKQADSIADLLNRDFNEWRDRVQPTAARASGGGDRFPKQPNDPDTGTGLVPGHDEPALISPRGGRTDQPPAPDPTDPKINPRPGPISDPTRSPATLPADQNAAKRGRRTDTVNSKPTATGGFRIEFVSMGPEQARAKYERLERTIFINLDHPQIVAARGSAGTDAPLFQRLAYEIASSEYAIALASEMNVAEYYVDISDPIVDIRETINRLALATAPLYGDQ